MNNTRGPVSNTSSLFSTFLSEDVNAGFNTINVEDIVTCFMEPQKLKSLSAHYPLKCTKLTISYCKIIVHKGVYHDMFHVSYSVHLYMDYGVTLERRVMIKNV